jgi:hypothetical protein
MSTAEQRTVPDSVLAAHGLRSLGERPTIEKLREMASAFLNAANDAERSLS